MYRKIVVALDGGKVAQSALEAALHLARSEDAELFPICVVEYPGTYYSSLVYDAAGLRNALVVDAGKILDQARQGMEKAAVRGEPRMVNGDDVEEPVAQQIQRAARDIGADMVVLGTHGRRGLQRMMLGSVAESFIRISDRPVLLVPQRVRQDQA